MPFFSRKPKVTTGQEVEAVDLASSPSSSQEKDINEKQPQTAENSHTAELEANKELKFLRKLHKWDPNLSTDITQGIDRAARDHDATAELELINLIENDSPYPEVRAAVRNWDEDNLPVMTVRAWTIGFLMVTIGTAMNVLFSLRSPSIVITAFVAQLISYPIGHGWDLIMPKSLCPGPFNIKEHTLITVMANVAYSSGSGPAYSTNIIVSMKAFYKFDFGWGFEILVTLSTQVIGYGFAGLLRKFLVYPASMIWPTNFVATSLFYALHDHTPTDPEKANGWKIGRYRYFLYVFLGSFVWYWFPGWIFQALSYFAFATWIAPDNIVVNQVFGYTSGLGLIPITFDWTQITGFTQSPLMFPWHAIANTLIGVVLWFLILTPALHYTGWGYAEYLPMSTSSSYDNTGAVYNVSKILTPEYTLDIEKYSQYSPLFLSTTFALCYGLSFASFLALVTHTALYHGQEIWTRFRLSRGEEPDVHTKMMRKYPEAPSWWFAVAFAIMLAVSFVSCLVWDTHLEAWALIIALLIAGFFCVPIGMIQATTNVQLGLNVITEFIIGYMQPGKPLAMMLFKTYGYISMTQALAFSQDLKLGHYMKIPPRAMFWGQMTATVWSCILQIAVLNWAFGNISGICDPKNPSHFTCPGGRVFFNASVIWGLIGPMRMFGPGQVYSGLMYFFIAGALAPPLFYILARMFPKSNLRYINVPLIFGGSGQIPPATTINYTSWGIVGFIFNKYIKNKYRGWWSTYNYITSAGLDTGLALSTIVIFLCLQLTQQQAPDWWGNNVITTTADANALTQSVVEEGQTFGPTVF